MSGERSTTGVLETDGGLESDQSRPMRADARRNYDRLVTAARAVFAEHGGDASMEAIAKEAGVGVGTLYRHFPKRIDVVEAVYRTDVEDLLRAADELSAELDPWQALVSWLEAFVHYALSKRTFLNELHEAFEKNPELRVQARDQIERSLTAILERAQAAGAARVDIDGPDLMQLIGSMCLSATLNAPQSERLLSMILDGLKPAN